MKPLLSIITINYNDKIGLENTLKSVVDQSYQAFEFIVIDGNSSDGSLEVLKSYDSNIDFWLSEPDSGIYNAMNKGILHAKGTYLLFLNSGDVLNGNTALHDFISHKNFEGDIIYGDYKFKNGGKVYPDKLTPLHFFKSALPHQSTFIKKSLFSEYGMYNENLKIVSDWEFFVKCFFSRKVQFKHINYPLSVFDLLGISNDVEHKSQLIAEKDMVLQKYYGFYYQDYKKHIQLELELSNTKRKTIKGVLKRIKKKLSYR